MQGKRKPAGENTVWGQAWFHFSFRGVTRGHSVCRWLELTFREVRGAAAVLWHLSEIKKRNTVITQRENVTKGSGLIHVCCYCLSHHQQGECSVSLCWCYHTSGKRHVSSGFRLNKQSVKHQKLNFSMFLCVSDNHENHHPVQTQRAIYLKFWHLFWHENTNSSSWNRPPDPQSLSGDYCGLQISDFYKTTILAKIIHAWGIIGILAN